MYVFYVCILVCVLHNKKLLIYYSIAFKPHSEDNIENRSFYTNITFFFLDNSNEDTPHHILYKLHKLTKLLHITFHDVNVCIPEYK